MKKALSLLIALLLCAGLAACGTSDEPSTPSTDGSEGEETSQVQPKVEDVAHEVTYKNCNVYKDVIGTIWIQTIIELENTGAKALYLSSGSYDLETPDGALVASKSMVSAYPDVILPGEKGYYYEEAMLDSQPETDLVVVPRIKVEKAKVDKIELPVSDVALSAKEYGDLKIIGRVENTTTKEQSFVYVCAVLFDAEQKPIGLMFTTLSDNLAAGDKVGFEMHSFALPDSVTVDSVASHIVFAYPMQMQF